MKAVGEAALGLPWISPCASSLVRLAKDGPAAWENLRTDPGIVLLTARAAGAGPFSLSILLESSDVLTLATDHVASPHGWVDWSQTAPARAYRLALRQAILAHAIAQATPGCDVDKAWISGMLAPLGWLAFTATDPECAGLAFASASEHGTYKTWNPDALARRLAHAWQLPEWLGAIIGHLGLSANVARRLGAEPRLFQVVQLACALVQHEEKLPLAPILADLGSLQAALGLSAESLERIQQRARAAEETLLAARKVWQRPSTLALLPDFLDMAIRSRLDKEREAVERLHGDLDQLQGALEELPGADLGRLHTMKLSALAELAAGAGHEINNPLAVISGEAQYALKQINQAEGELVEDAAALAVLHELRGRLERSLSAVVGQAQRIHHVLTDLMQFARPPAPRRQSVRLGDLMREATQAVAGLAEVRKVRVTCAEPSENWSVQVDPGQVRTALVALLRNAIEAAPQEGWTGLRAEARDNAVDLFVEDSGTGPSTLALEHMFDPFFSGRNAGRGRGLSLPTAWRLARQHGGDLRFVGATHGITCFVLTLPDLDVSSAANDKESGNTNGNGHYSEPSLQGVNGSH